MNLWRVEEPSPEQIKEMKSKWFTMEEVIENLAVDGKLMSESSFHRIAKQVDYDKEIFYLGKPEIKKEKPKGKKGRPKQIYNMAFVTAIRSLAINDTFRKIEELPIDFFVNSDWKREVKDKFVKILVEFEVDSKDTKILAEELLNIVGEDIIQKYNAIIGQNKLLVHRNRSLEDTKEYYIAVQRGVEENANVLNDIAKFIKSDISESSNLLIRKESAYLKVSLNVNQKLDEILEALEDIKK